MFRLAGSQPTAFTALAISRWPCGMPARAMCSASAPTVILGPGAASRRSPARPRKSRRAWLPRLGAVFRRAKARKAQGSTTGLIASRPISTRHRMVHLATRPSSRSPQSPHKTESATVVLALQLHSPFEMGAARFGLMGSSPERPCDDVRGLDAPLCKLDDDTADFLDRPADQERA